MLLVLPVFYFLTFIFSFFVYSLFNRKDRQETRPSFNEINKANVKLKLLLYITTVCFSLNYGINVAIQTLTNYKLFNILQSFVFCISLAILVLICYTLFYSYKVKSNYFSKNLLFISVLYALIYTTGNLLEVVLKGVVTEKIAEVCIGYGFFILL